MRSSTSSGSFVPPRGEELDAVVGRRVVRRRDHHAEVGVDVGDQVGRGRRRDDAGVEHVDAGAGEPRRDGGGDELAGDARVAGDDGDGALARGAALLGVRPWPRTTAAAWARPEPGQP